MTAAEVYVDPSALARLYIHQDGSREMAAWRARMRGALAVTHHGRTEVINAICRAAFLFQWAFKMRLRRAGFWPSGKARARRISEAICNERATPPEGQRTSELGSA